MNSELKREALGLAIVEAAMKVGIIKEYQDFTGPQLILLVDDLVRAALSTEAQPEVTGAVAWYYEDVDGNSLFSKERKLVHAYEFEQALYPPSAVEGYAQELAKRLVREKLEEIQDALHVDLENGVKWLNEKESEIFKKKYPNLLKALQNNE